MWLRWTLPRPRIDQVLYACVKVLLPLACVLLLGGALWELLVPDLTLPIPFNAMPDAFNPWLYMNPGPSLPGTTGRDGHADHANPVGDHRPGCSSAWSAG
jgi:hypothetical protein